MLTVTAGAGGRYKTIAEALACAPPDSPLRIILSAGEYREKLFCCRRATFIEGEDSSRTHIIWQDGAFDINGDGRANGTFRSETAFFDGDFLRLQGLSIENRAGVDRGQAVAAAVYTKAAWISGVAFRSTQDTLFLGPLPERERLPDGFLGPRQFTKRINSKQLYENCRIEGDIDFIFGGADALFKSCELAVTGERRGFLTAPSSAGALGFVFEGCALINQSTEKPFLARPWRDNARAYFINCTGAEDFDERGFDKWYAESFCFGEYPAPKRQREFSVPIGKSEAQGLLLSASALEWEVKCLAGRL